MKPPPPWVSITRSDPVISLRSHPISPSGFALMFLTALTVACARIDLGALNLVIALAIASIKAALVALFFMHLIYDDKFNIAILAAGLIFVGIFCALTVTDMLTARARSIPGNSTKSRRPPPCKSHVNDSLFGIIPLTFDAILIMILIIPNISS